MIFFVSNNYPKTSNFVTTKNIQKKNYLQRQTKNIAGSVCFPREMPWRWWRSFGNAFLFRLIIFMTHHLISDSVRNCFVHVSGKHFFLSFSAGSKLKSYNIHREAIKIKFHEHTTANALFLWKGIRVKCTLSKEQKKLRLENVLNSDTSDTVFWTFKILSNKTGMVKSMS